MRNIEEIIIERKWEWGERKKQRQTEIDGERKEQIETGKTMTDRQQADRHLYKYTDRVTDKQIQTKYKQTQTDTDRQRQPDTDIQTGRWTERRTEEDKGINRERHKKTGTYRER